MSKQVFPTAPSPTTTHLFAEGGLGRSITDGGSDSLNRGDYHDVRVQVLVEGLVVES